MTWSARRESFDASRPNVRLVNRKTNLTASLHDVVFQFEFTAEGPIVVSSTLDAEEPESAVSGPSSTIRHGIVSILQERHGQPIKVSEIAQMLQAKEETVKENADE